MAAIPTMALADGDFGTKAEAKELADAMIAIVESEGIEAAIMAMHDATQPFVGSRMGVNLFQGSTVIADNREPETIAADYSETEDLTGSLVWPIIAAAAAVEGDAELKWYHYDTQEEYDYKCHSKRHDRGNATVMVCR
ncbi:hypothetical protein GQ651_10140 [Alphaproteobacteria bacterium GH1-50]|uniref:Uncharacterized protein n=2 Tax=Kangsaoukella pontilimi TaxID=2691042 RepID=A0A7C9II82_9RHOB|nr:hypothetical protein [Kangsaoukella pontilimi]